MQACAAAHEELPELKAALVPQILAMNDEDCGLERVPERLESLPGLSENLQPAEPKPLGLAQKKKMKVSSSGAGQVMAPYRQEEKLRSISRCIMHPRYFLVSLPVIPITEGPRGRGPGGVVPRGGGVRGGCGVKVAVRG